MSCGSGFVEDVTIREDSPSSQSDDQSWGGLEAAFADTVEVNPLLSWHVQDKDKAAQYNYKNLVNIKDIYLCNTFLVLWSSVSLLVFFTSWKIAYSRTYDHQNTENLYIEKLKRKLRYI